MIRRGGVCVLPNWIPPHEVDALRTSISVLRAQGAFHPSGLSNRQRGDTNEFGASDRRTCTVTHEIDDVDQDARRPVEERLEQLRRTLEDTFKCHLELSEQYYSISPASSFLPRHMDERHEETKGEKGWENTSRRSISWLLYLNNAVWNSEANGGELRLYCRQSNHKCGAHKGDLQVGWLPSTTLSSERNLWVPVFLDSWKKIRCEDEWVPRSALYRLAPNGRRDYLSEAFGPDSPTWPSSDGSLEPDEFAAALAMQLTSSHHQQSFRGVEQLVDAEIVDVLPVGGTLVLFDSVVVPHEVLETKQGERIAMAGWFHEPVQDFPDWYGA